MVALQTSTPSPDMSSVASPPASAKIWWSNATFFVGIHVAAALGVWLCPPQSVPWQTLVLAAVLWQSAQFGITIGYHRLWSHRSFRASTGVRAALALLGAAGFQGSIKWWCLRHRLHHRFTDDPRHDPYAATRGLLWSHMGWIFYKPTYEKMESVDREDLDGDVVVRLQHKYYVPLALAVGFVVPTMIGAAWGDAIGAYIYGGLVTRLFIWHCTFLVNSLAHWDGLQAFSDENTSRGNLLFALLTCGEGNHNFHHAFPNDFRAGPHTVDWDPSKWIILTLHRLGFVNGLRRARKVDISDAKAYMHHQHRHGVPPVSKRSDWAGAVWDQKQTEDFVRAKAGRCVVIVDGFAVDVTAYLGEHPGGAALLRNYSLRVNPEDGTLKWRDATWAFDGGLNQHSRAAKRRLRELRVAKVSV